MRRLLQIVSGLLAVLACALLWRIVQVFRVAPPSFGEVTAVVAVDPLPAPPRSPSPRGAAMDAIVEGNLFESERGRIDASAGSGALGEEPLPPPTNVILNGIFSMEGRPMAIVSDSTAGNKQLTLRVGDNVGDYQVGEITDRRVTLLGRGGQQFSLDLDIKKGPQAGAVPIAPRAQATTRQPPTPAQTAAQRAAAARAAAAANRAPQPPQRGRPADRVEDSANPTQARLDALRRLRETSER
jgi:hypothetical protein